MCLLHGCRGGEYSVTLVGGRPAGWRQPEGASPHATTSFNGAAEHRRFHHSLSHTVMWCIGFLSWDCSVNCEMILFLIWWIDVHSWTHSLEGGAKWPVVSMPAKIQLLGETHSCLRRECVFIHEWYLSALVWKRKDPGMRLIWYGKVSGRWSERPINDPINASSLIRGCQSPLALPFDTCYCFHGNWYSHSRPHINIQLHLICLLSGGC